MGNVAQGLRPPEVLFIAGIGLVFTLVLSGCSPAPGTWIEPGTCFGGVNGAFPPDVRFDGPADTFGNYTVFYDPSDGSCTGSAITPGPAIIQATDDDSAELKCALMVGFGQRRSTSHLKRVIPSAPADAWICAALD